MEMKLYIANLGKYNEGKLVGEWISLPFTDDEYSEMLDRIQICHDDKNYYDECGNPYEEVAIHDYETDLDIEISKYSNIEDLNILAEELDSLSEEDIEHLKAYIEVTGELLEDALYNYEYSSFYENYSIEELAEEFITEGLLGEYLAKAYEENSSYIDLEAIARDLRYEYTEVSNGVICTY